MAPGPATVRVENLHYDLSENDLRVSPHPTIFLSIAIVFYDIVDLANSLY